MLRDTCGRLLDDLTIILGKETEMPL